MTTSGIIVEERKNYYLVETDKGELVRSVLKGRIKKKHKRLFAGDFVDIDIFDKEEAVIKKLHERRNFILKPSVANIDRVLLLVSLKEPLVDNMYIDRFIFYMSVMNIPVTIVVNKIELLEDNSEIEQLMKIYNTAGYKVIPISAKEDINLQSVVDICQRGLSVFAGASGVGKSTTLSRIFPDIEFQTNPLSRHIDRGVNTTTFTRLLKISRQGFVADTPGFSFVDLPKVEISEVKYHFEEFPNDCKFSDCIHQKEPECSVKKYIESNDVIRSRYNNYLKILGEIKEKSKKY